MVKALLICEYREGRLLESSYELVAFAEKLGAESVMFLVGDITHVPRFDGTLHLAEAACYGECNAEAHCQLVLAAFERERPDYIVFLHSSYGWDLAPRVATRLGVGQVSEVVAVSESAFAVACCNAKMRRTVRPTTDTAVLTVQAGAFGPVAEPHGTPRIERLVIPETHAEEFLGYEPAGAKDVDLSQADVIVSAGRGIGSKDNVAAIAALADALGGEMGASRPAVDLGWVEHSRQVGTTGQTVAPKVYLACGISGAIQHLAGMKGSGFVVAINKDRDAPIVGVADVMVVADVVSFASALTAKLTA